MNSINYVDMKELLIEQINEELFQYSLISSKVITKQKCDVIDCASEKLIEYGKVQLNSYKPIRIVGDGMI